MTTPARSTLLSLMSSASSPAISPPVISSVDVSATMPAVNVERTTLAVRRRITEGWWRHLVQRDAAAVLDLDAVVDAGQVEIGKSVADALALRCRRDDGGVQRDGPPARSRWC